MMLKSVSSVQSLSCVQLSWVTLCDPIDWNTPGFPVHHQLLEPNQNHVHRVGDAIQPFHPLSSPSPPAFNLSQPQGLFQRVSSSQQVVKVLELQLQHHKAEDKEPDCQCRRRKRCGIDPCPRKIPWNRAWQPTPVFLLGEFPWTEKPGGIQSIGWLRVRHIWSDMAHNNKSDEKQRLKSKK